MNDSQQIYAVFYAIFWGGIFNVLSRWKPFNFGLISHKRKNIKKLIRKRIGLALIIFNVLPIIYFGTIFYILGEQNICEVQKKYWYYMVSIVLSGIIPAFAILGFYRLWLGIVEKWPKTFYLQYCNIPRENKIYRKCKRYQGEVHEPEPSLEKLGLDQLSQYSWRNNLIVGSIFIYLWPFSLLFSDITTNKLMIYILITVFVILFPIVYSYCVSKGQRIIH